MAITATDNEQLATELWGSDKYWDEDRQQFLPNKAGDDVSVGNKSEASLSETEKSDETNQQDPPPNAQMTELFSFPETDDTTVHLTDGNGAEKTSRGE